MSSRSSASVSGSRHPRLQLRGVETGVAGGVADGVRFVQQLTGEVANPKPAQQGAHPVGSVSPRGHHRPAGGTVAAIRGRSRVSIGIPWCSAIVAKASAWRPVSKPLLSYSSGDSARPTMHTRHSIMSP